MPKDYEEHKKEYQIIAKEALVYVENNKGTKLADSKRKYPSPRISSEYMDCSMPLTFDSYSHCSLGCTYCFAYFFKSNNPSMSDELHSIDAKKMLEGMQGKSKFSRQKMMYEHFYKDKFLLHWGGLADPFCNFERTNGVGFELIEGLAEMDYPTLFSFKGDSIFDKKYMSFFGKHSKQKNFAFQISIVTASDELSKMVEIGVPPTSRRIEALKELSDMGYYTVLRLRPYIIGVSDEGLDELLEKSLAAGIGGVSMEFFAMDCRCNVGMKQRYDWLAKIMGIEDLQKYYRDLSPSKRGGYMRLNRLVKEPHARKVYEFCVKHGLVFGCSDPDFKELNTSGSCCGMPDEYPDNPGLENWSRDQLTYHLKEARIHYHTTGECRELHFEDVFTGEVTFIDDHGFTNDHIKVSGLANAERYAHTYKSFALETWNNLKSPQNPRNYFDYKFIPTNVDTNGNIVYKYNPMPYEKRWTDEGVDLTK